MEAGGRFGFMVSRPPLEETQGPKLKASATRVAATAISRAPLSGRYFSEQLLTCLNFIVSRRGYLFLS
jgi:hypothetical protein